MDPARIQAHEAQIQRLRILVATARNVPQTISDVFPVKGRPWSFKGHPNDAAGAIVQVCNALRYLEGILHPPRTSEGRKEPEARISNATSYEVVGEPATWGSYHNLVQRILHEHDIILNHYKLLEYITGKDISKLPWKPSAVPPIRAELLDSLRDAADGLDRRIVDHERRLNEERAKQPGTPALVEGNSPTELPIGYKRAILLAYLQLGATSEAKAMSLPAVVRTMANAAYPDNYKTTANQLKDDGLLLATGHGPGSGRYLTREGVKMARRLNRTENARPKATAKR